MTGHGDVPMVLSSLREGVFDFFAKPIDTEQLVASARRAMSARRLVLENRYLKALAQDISSTPFLIGETPAIVRARETIEQVAATDLDVLIVGEYGTGKRDAGEVIHKKAQTSSGKFVHVNFGALPENALDGALFGYALGADPHSRKERAGYLEQAHAGTLFLDEIELIPMNTQGQLLASLEMQSVTRIGSNRSHSVKHRVIAATQIDLDQAVNERRFRRDLLMRLNTVTISLPPLRERRADIPIIFAQFLSEAAERQQRKLPKISVAARKRLLDYDWPGNLRELSNFAASLVSGVTPALSTPTEDAMTLPDRVERFEGNAIRAVLEQTQGDVRTSVELLGIPRKTFYDKITRHEIDLKSYRKAK